MSAGRALPAITRFWRLVNKNGPVPAHRPDLGPCWLWLGWLSPAGYGKFNPVHGQPWYAHRWAYTTLVGPIPEGLEPDHLCFNQSCVNPAHLEAVTHLENIRRGAARITHCPHGHPYDEANTLRRNNGYRICRACQAKHAARAYARRRAALVAQQSNEGAER